ncbi:MULTISPECIES: phage holin family protein [Anaerolinea]|jgi:putative membrane protein|uniref:phage holin family protein n=1 Tax=Anaerolinea TaxID=233189 RepID=UPI002624C8C7|nr:phage holin family protein [Anaerolinea thermophila]
MQKLLIRLGINAVALYTAIYLLSGRGITHQFENWWEILWLALIFGLVNALVRPFVIAMSCPLLILTLGLGTLLVNTLMFVMAGWIGTQFGVGFEVDGFLPAFLGALIVSVVSALLSLFFHDEPRKHRPRPRRD